jgi:hypothetical protein
MPLALQVIMDFPIIWLPLLHLYSMNESARSTTEECDGFGGAMQRHFGNALHLPVESQVAILLPINSNPSEHSSLMDLSFLSNSTAFPGNGGDVHRHLGTEISVPVVKQGKLTELTVSNPPLHS